ncbi:MAG: ABC transporter substrate-binding protein [Bacteroidetes bacterium]|nr:ABC transporter substrate-binding protein [Bacteroidota bacterium]
MKFTDQTGSTIILENPPTKIISVVPSQTELLFDLGLQDEVIGITKFCIHPDEWFKTKTRIGGTKKLDIEKIFQLQPDIIFANKEENERTDIEVLKAHFPVWISDIKDLKSANEMILSIGEITGKEQKALNIVSDIRNQFDSLHFSMIKQCIYLIWNNPIMTVGGDTFINDMLQYAGYHNLTNQQKRYPELSIDQLKKLNPELVLLSSEPFPFSQEHIEYFKALLPFSKVIKVDGEMFSWYGSRLLKSPLYFSKLRSEIENAS